MPGKIFLSNFTFTINKSAKLKDFFHMLNHGVECF